MQSGTEECSMGITKGHYVGWQGEGEASGRPSRSKSGATPSLSCARLQLHAASEEAWRGEEGGGRKCTTDGPPVAPMKKSVPHGRGISPSLVSTTMCFAASRPTTNEML